MEFKFGRKTLFLWQLRVGAAFAALTLFFALLAAYSIYLYIPAALAVLLGVILIFCYLPAFFSRYKVFVGKTSVVVTRGVFVVKSHIMPFKRLVFAGGYSTPLARLFRLEGITLRAARATVIMPEIECDAARRLIFELGGDKSDD